MPHSELVSRIIMLLRDNPALLDREITQLLFGSNARHRQVDAACRLMQERGIIKRIKPALEDPEVSASHSPNLASPPFSPDNLLAVKCNMEIVKQKVSEKTVLNEPERLKIVQAHCFSRSLHMI